MKIELDKDHIYKVNGEEVPSVTTILQTIAKPALLYWAVNSSVGYIDEIVKDGKDKTSWEDIIINAKKEPDMIKR